MLYVRTPTDPTVACVVLVTKETEKRVKISTNVLYRSMNAIRMQPASTPKDHTVASATQVTKETVVNA